MQCRRLTAALGENARSAAEVAHASSSNEDLAHDLASLVFVAASDACMRPAALYESCDLLRALLAACMPEASQDSAECGHALLAALASGMANACEGSVSACASEGLAPVLAMADVRAPAHRSLAACLPLLCHLCDAASAVPSFAWGHLVHEPTLRAAFVAYVLAVLAQLDFTEPRTLAFRCVPLSRG